MDDERLCPISTRYDAERRVRDSERDTPSYLTGQVYSQGKAVFAGMDAPPLFCLLMRGRGNCFCLTLNYATRRMDDHGRECHAI
jgi:hypothetical protein